MSASEPALFELLPNKAKESTTKYMNVRYELFYYIYRSIYIQVGRQDLELNNYDPCISLNDKTILIHSSKFNNFLPQTKGELVNGV